MEQQFCENCGKELFGEIAFCPCCGNPAKSPQEQGNQPDVEAIGPVGQAVSQGVASLEQEPPFSPAPPAKKKRGILIATITVAAVVILVLSVIIVRWDTTRPIVNPAFADAGSEYTFRPDGEFEWATDGEWAELLENLPGWKIMCSKKTREVTTIGFSAGKDYQEASDERIAGYLDGCQVICEFLALRIQGTGDAAVFVVDGIAYPKIDLNLYVDEGVWCGGIQVFCNDFIQEDGTKGARYGEVETRFLPNTELDSDWVGVLEQVQNAYGQHEYFILLDSFANILETDRYFSTPSK